MGAGSRNAKILQQQPTAFNAANGLALSLLAQVDEGKIQKGLEYARLNAASHSSLRTKRGVQAAAVLAWALYRNSQREEAKKLIRKVLSTRSLTAETGYFAAVILAANQPDLAEELV